VHVCAHNCLRRSRCIDTTGAVVYVVRVVDMTATPFGAHCRLPIQENMVAVSSLASAADTAAPSLSVNHIVHALLRMSANNNWRTSLASAVPVTSGWRARPSSPPVHTGGGDSDLTNDSSQTEEPRAFTTSTTDYERMCDVHLGILTGNKCWLKCVYQNRELLTRMTIFSFQPTNLYSTPNLQRTHGSRQ
jgi:hypothetical protein